MRATTQVAVITGAAQGLGFSLSQTCLKQGIGVLLADLDPDHLAIALAQLQSEYGSLVTGMVCDVQDMSQVEQLAEQAFTHFGRVDYLFNNAGISGSPAPLWEMPIDKVAQVMDVNLLGVVRCIQAFMPRLARQTNPSHIINIGSMYSLCSSGLMSAYAMSKHALLALSESLYFDCQAQQLPVSISLVMSSFINTGLLKHSRPAQEASLHDAMAEWMSRSRPAEEVAEHILASVAAGQFYILPDPEVKVYAQQRLDSICQQQEPHRHSLQKIMGLLQKRIKV